jgi:hypothetical protein
MKYRTFIAVGIVLIMGFTMMSMQAGATAPRYLGLKYTPGTLSLTILHFSPVPKIHYIYKVDIEKNGVLYHSQQYTSQPKFFFYTYTYSVNATTGDILRVTATCILFGHLTRSITV